MRTTLCNERQPCVYWFRPCWSRFRPFPGAEKRAPPAQTPEVGIVTLEAQTVTLNTELPGRTNAFRIAEVRPQVNGIILKRLFKEGSDVKAGQQLYQIDPATYEADYQSAQANLASTQEQAQRYKLLVADQAVSKQQYADANAAYRSPRRRWNRRGSTCATPGAVADLRPHRPFRGDRRRPGDQRPGQRDGHRATARPDLRRRHPAVHRPAALAANWPAASWSAPATTRRRSP